MNQLQTKTLSNPTDVPQLLRTRRRKKRLRIVAGILLLLAVVMSPPTWQAIRPKLVVGRLKEIGAKVRYPIAQEPGYFVGTLWFEADSRLLPDFLLTFPGVDFFATPDRVDVSGMTVDPGLMDDICKLQLEIVSLSNCRVSNEALEIFSRADNCRTLSLDASTGFDVDGLSHLTNLKCLRNLYLPESSKAAFRSLKTQTGSKIALW